jgi:hypothetical protein
MRPPSLLEGGEDGEARGLQFSKGTAPIHHSRSLARRMLAQYDTELRAIAQVEQSLSKRQKRHASVLVQSIHTIRDKYAQSLSVAQSDLGACVRQLGACHKQITHRMAMVQLLRECTRLWPAFASMSISELCGAVVVMSHVEGWDIPSCIVSTLQQELSPDPPTGAAQPESMKGVDDLDGEEDDAAEGEVGQHPCLVHLYRHLAPGLQSAATVDVASTHEGGEGGSMRSDPVVQQQQQQLTGVDLLRWLHKRVWMKRVPSFKTLNAQYVAAHAAWGQAEKRVRELNLLLKSTDAVVMHHVLQSGK